METIEQTVFKFSELSESAKEKARDWWRRDQDFDLDHVLDDVATIGQLFGLDVNTRRVSLMNGSTRNDPAILWTGFWSQGDGACFEGTYAYSKGALDAVKSYAPEDDSLHAIVRRLQKVQARNFYRLEASTAHRGRYCHEYSMSIDVSRSDDRPVSDDDAEELSDCLRDFARWIYRALESEYEYQSSDEVTDELLESYGCTFDEDGNHV